MLNAAFFDQLKKDDPQLRLIALVVLGGLGVLLAGFWWVQVVSARDYQANLETQSFRTVRIPAVRGKILDRNGMTLAENRPTYNVSLYLEELRKPFDAAYIEEPAGAGRAEAEAERSGEEAEPQANQGERKHVRPHPERQRPAAATGTLRSRQQCGRQVSQRLQQPLALDATNFERHYETRLALPFPVLTNLDPAHIARFEEQSTSPLGVDLEVQSTRFYPYEPPPPTCWAICGATTVRRKAKRLSSRFGCRITAATSASSWFRQGAARHGRRQIGPGE